RAFAALRASAGSGQADAAALASIQRALDGFRAAPLSPAALTRRAGQALRYLGLVPTEYARGVKDGVVTRDLELREAITFRTRAAAAFAALQPALVGRDPGGAAEVSRLFALLEQQLNDAGNGTAVASPATIQGTTDQLATLLRNVMPPEWLRRDSSGD